VEYASKLLSRPDGKSVIVALDHGLNLGAVPGLEYPPKTLEAVLAGKPDGILAGPHFARHYRHMWADRPDFKLLLTADWMAGCSVPGSWGMNEIWSQMFEVQELADLGADAVKMLFVCGWEDPDLHRKNMLATAKLARECHQLGLPLVAEPLPIGRAIPFERAQDPELIAHACRMAWEFGADVIKLGYVGPKERFAEILAASPVPVLILGGPKTDAPAAALQMVEDSMEAGARGVVLGRNIWQHPDVTGMVRKVSRIVHGKPASPSRTRATKSGGKNWAR